MATVTFDNATRIYPGTERPAVDALNLDIADGEFLVLVGPSGCGKSTSLRMLAGLEDVDQGSIWVGDRDVTHVQPKDRDIAMVFQSYALYPHMTVADNMGFALKIAKVDKAEIRQRVEAAAKILDLTEYLDRKPKALSGGQRQRVAMGRAIVRQPQVFLMDEPLSNLDAKLRVQTRTQIAALQRRLGTTTVYVTHDQTEALTMGDRIAVLKDGVLQQIGHCLVNGDDRDRLPNTSNIAFEYLEGEAILTHLDRAGVAASTGSACAAGSTEPSHVLCAMRLPASALRGAIRFSLSRENTDEDIDRVLDVLPGIVAKLRTLSLSWQSRPAAEIGAPSRELIS